MPTTTFLAPKEPRNLKATAGACGFLLVVYVAGSWQWTFSPKRGLGLCFGILATLLFGFLMAYPFRRPRARPLGTAKSWIQAHVYLGVVACLAVLIHADFAFPHGAMGWWLLLLTLWTTASGLAGVWLQKWIPSAISQGLRVEALYERIPELIDRLREEADGLAAEASETLESFYRRDVRPAMAGPSPSWSYLLDVRAGRERALQAFDNIGRFVGDEDKGRARELMNIYTEKLELDAQYRLQRVLRHWLIAHTPVAALLLGLVVVHIASWLWY